MLKIGVLGAGHLGKIHIKCLKALPQEYTLVGFFDPDTEAAKKVAADFDLKRFDTIDQLIAAVDVVDVVTPTLNHYDCAVKTLRQRKHLFIEKPITETSAQAKELIKLSEEAEVVAQVGHVERFNPAFLSARNYIQNPMFIETHRLAEFNPRGTDVPVVLDLMIHDLDIILSVVKSGLKKINASGVAVVSDTPDIANARLEFDNGCVANLTASRISLKNMRKTRIFQRDAYITLDFLEKESEVIRMKNVQPSEEDPYAMILDLGNGKQKQVYFEKPERLEINAIQEELRSFAQSINKKVEASVTLDDGYQALRVAEEILTKIQLNLNHIA